MKKLIFSLIVSILVIPSISFATSGACSSHGGVNCSAGSAYSKVTCNDGWVNSSVYFSDMDECKQESSCKSLIPKHYGCDVERPKQEAQKQAKERYDSASLMWAMGGYSTVNKPILEDWTQDIYYIQCKAEQELSDIEMNIYNICISNEFKTYEQESKRIDATTQIKLNAICEENNGEGSVWDKSVKKDIDGLQCNPTKEQKDIKCKEKDENSFYFLEFFNSCLCNKGFSYDESIKKCKLKEVKQEVVQPVVVQKEPIKKPSTIEAIVETPINNNISKEKIKSIDSPTRTPEELKALTQDLTLSDNQSGVETKKSSPSPIKRLWGWFTNLFK